MKMHLFILISVAASFAFANESGGHGAAATGHGWNEHTRQTIIYQCINVSILLGGITYFLRSKIKQFFTDKRAQYILESERANQARKAAEDEHIQIQVRLTKLASTAEESVARARAEAADMKAQLILDAKALSNRIREEAMQSAKLEIEKAKNQLRVQMVKESIELARSQMGSKVSTEDHQRLQGEFITNIRGVQA